MEYFPGINTRAFGRKHTWISDDEAKITPTMKFREAAEAWMRIKSPLGTDGTQQATLEPAFLVVPACL